LFREIIFAALSRSKAQREALFGELPAFAPGMPCVFADGTAHANTIMTAIAPQSRSHLMAVRRRSVEVLMDRTLLEYSPETEAFRRDVAGLGETELPHETRGAEVFDEADEMEFAASLLEVTDEAELDLFLGNLIRSAGRAVGGFVSSPVGQSLGGILKRAARQALPVVGRGIGDHLGGASGADMGGRVAQAAGRYFGLELEGLSPEDQEFEAAKGFVRFAGEAVKNAAGAATSTPPQAAVQDAAVQAARRYAPGLLGNIPRLASADQDARLIPSRGGRWVRRGRSIVVVNC
jgi:hypothetical protein